MLRRFAVGGAALLALALTLMTVPVAHAAPKSTESLCSSVATRVTGALVEDPPLQIRALVQELKNSDGTSCYEYRGVLQYRTTSGTLSFSGRDAMLTTAYGSGVIPGSLASSSATVTATTSWASFYGNWVSRSCNQVFYGQGIAYPGAVQSTGVFGTC